MKTQMPRLSAFATVGLVILSSANVKAQFQDDFNSGNDNGWTRYEPLASSGAPGTFSFPSGGYRIQAGPSPDLGSLGPGRAGSFRLDQTVSAAGFIFDVLGWDTGLQQSFGCVAGGHELGFGTLDGYAFTYSTAGFIGLYRIDNENWTSLRSSSIQLDPSQGYRFILDANSHGLSGTVYPYSDLANAVGLVRYVQPIDASGFSGLLVRADAGGGAADATFDNFSIGVVPEPSATVLLLGGLATLWFTARKRLRREKRVKREREVS